MRIPRKIKTLPIPIGLALIGIYLVINALSIQNYLGQATTILDIQKIVGISQIILGIATALIVSSAASSFLLSKNINIIDDLLITSLIRYRKLI